jgi:hypothetical protein
MGCGDVTRDRTYSSVAGDATSYRGVAWLGRSHQRVEQAVVVPAIIQLQVFPSRLAGDERPYARGAENQHSWHELHLLTVGNSARKRPSAGLAACSVGIFDVAVSTTSRKRSDSS